MTDKNKPGPAPVITETQRQGLRIANMAVKNWGARITIESVVHIHRYNLDDPSGFNQVIKQIPFMVDGATAGGDGTSALLDELGDELRDSLKNTEIFDEIEANVQAALAGKERP